MLFINENFGNVSKGESGLSNSSEDEQAKVITTLRSGKLYNNKVFYDPQTRMQVPFSSPSFMELCLISANNLNEENGVGGEENVPSNILECGDDILLKHESNMGVDKEAGREENVPTGGASKEDSEEWKKYIPKELWEENLPAKENQRKISVANPSGWKLASNRLGARQNSEVSTPS